MRRPDRYPYRSFIILLAMALLLAVCLSLQLGAVRIPLAEIPGALLGRGEHALIIRELRLPRILLSLLVGSSLGLAGMVLQALFRNPMADPYIVGISSGASLGAALVLAGGWSASLMGLEALPAAAFLGALGTAWLVYMLSCRDGRTSVYSLLLSGVAVSALISALTSLIMILGGRDLQAIFFWIMGGFYAADWRQVLLVLPYFAVAALFTSWRWRDLNLLLAGEEDARHLGMDVEKAKRQMLAVTSLLTAAAVSVSGVIGFVGLIVPHAARMLIGPDHRRLAMASALLGALVLLSSDMAARTVLAPAEIPVGLVTALLGAPFFIYLLYRRVHG